MCMSPGCHWARMVTLNPLSKSANAVDSPATPAPTTTTCLVISEKECSLLVHNSTNSIFLLPDLVVRDSLFWLCCVSRWFTGKLYLSLVSFCIDCRLFWCQCWSWSIGLNWYCCWLWCWWRIRSIDRVIVIYHTRNRSRRALHLVKLFMQEIHQCSVTNRKIRNKAGRVMSISDSCILKHDWYESMCHVGKQRFSAVPPCSAWNTVALSLFDC